MSSKDLSDYTAEDLLLRAAQFEHLAETARTPETRQSLEALATRLRTFARKLDHHRPWLLPGEPAPAAGYYELQNIFGARVGTCTQVGLGEPLPPAPRGFRWQKAEPILG
ncbi:MAG TPA: hypothetical protein VFL55_03655 [Acetobacteraceae bacterium]|nr:hypothetical protein [Acetobacteraceae bacterium]